MLNLRKEIINIQKIINSALYEYISIKSLKTDKKIIRAIKYSLLKGGKRIRPTLCIAAAKSVGGTLNTVIPLACGIEMIHTYSLIHDDLPLMDDDILRRGKMTCHIYFGQTTAMLAGNALLTLAFEILTNFEIFKKFYSYKIALKIIHKISIAVGLKGMINGQIKDINSEGLILNYKEIKMIHSLKTGMLIKSSIICGALASGANKNELNALKIYAHNIGLAFQITDDILNIIGSPLTLGKNIRTDTSKLKNTYPSIMGVDISKKLVKNSINKAIIAINKLDDKANYLRCIAYYLLKRIM